MSNNQVTFTEDQMQQLLRHITNLATEQKSQQKPVIQPAFRAKDIGYFDPDNEAEPVEHSDGKTIYHELYSFTKRLQVKQHDQSNIARQVDQCLLGRPGRWFIDGISDTTRAGIQTSVDLWISEPENRLKIALKKPLPPPYSS